MESEFSLRLLIALLLAFAAAACDRQKPEGPQPEAPGAAPSPAAAKGKIDRSHAGEAAPSIGFNDPDGEPASFADFRGRPLLVNLWATWCAPCIAEMPTLDALAARNRGIQVLAVSQDFQGQEAKVRAFFEERKLKAVEAYQDPELALMEAAKVDTLPTTILYDANGREVWRMVGAFDWNGAEAAKLLAAR